MTLTRNTYYWLWFLLFGVISSLVTFLHTNHLGSEDRWLLVIGFVALLVGAKSVTPIWVKPFDLAVGILFFAVGILGILHTFGVNLTNTSTIIPTIALTPVKFLGFSLALEPAVLHTALGFLSLRFALKSPSSSSSLEVSTAPK